MRIKMRLDKETNLLLKFYKAEYIKTDDFNYSYGLLISNIVNELEDSIDKIDWKLVKDTKLKDFSTSDSVLYGTTFNITTNAEKILNKIQYNIRQDFKISRVHKSFAVRISLKAFYLKKFEKIDIYKK